MPKSDRSRQRRVSLRGIAHRIAWQLGEISKPYTSKGEVPPGELLEKHFLEIIGDCDDLRGGPMTSPEVNLLAEKLVPAAVEKITRRVTRTNGQLEGLMDTLERRAM